MRGSLAGRALRALVARRGSIVTPLSKAWQPDIATIRQTRAMVPILLTDPAALHLITCVRAACRLTGEMAEAGVFKGGSARLICEAKGKMPLHLFDVFESLQQSPGADGAEVRDHFGPVHGVEQDVERLLAPYPAVRVHRGLFPGSAKGLEQIRYSFVHLDLDLAGPTRAALEFFRPRMVPGAILLGDDYDDPALRETFADHFESSPDTLIELPWSQVMVVRQGPA